MIWPEYAVEKHANTTFIVRWALKDCCSFCFLHSLSHRYTPFRDAEHRNVVCAIPERDHIVRTDAKILTDQLEGSSFVDIRIMQLENKGDCLRESQRWILRCQVQGER